VKTPIRRLLAGLTIATAAATGSLTATGTAAADTPSTTSSTVTDTGGSNTEDDTAWGAPPIIGTIVTTLDTAWG